MGVKKKSTKQKPKLDKKQEARLTIIITCAVIYLVMWLVVCHLVVVMRDENTASIAESLSLAISRIFLKPLEIFPPPSQAVSIMLGITFIGGIFLGLEFIKLKNKKHYNSETIEGDARWLTKADLEKYNEQYTSPLGKPYSEGIDNMILSQEMCLTMDNQATGRNNNVLVIGGSGAGKSFRVVAPNLLQANSSYVVTDPSGGLLKQYGHYLENMGYRVKVFDTTDFARSNHYNPFKYIHSDKDIEILANTIVVNSVAEGAKPDEFWDNTVKILLTALIALLWHYYKPEQQNFTNLLELIRKCQFTENGGNVGESETDAIFAELASEGSFAYSKYAEFKLAAGKTLRSILISALAKLNVYDLQDVKDMMLTDDLELDKLGDEKTALFVVTSTGDTTFKQITSLMYAQLFQTLYDYAEKNAEYSTLIADSEGQIWKTYRASSKEEQAQKIAEANNFFERCKNGKVVKNKKLKWYEIRTDLNEFVGYRGTRQGAEKALEKLKNGKIVKNSELSNGGNRLPIHTSFILDEFKQIGKIPSFPEKVATIRKYEISVMIILQSLSQLKSMYEGRDWNELTGNCDTTVYLGGGYDEDTLTWLSQQFGKETRKAMSESYNTGGGSQSFQAKGVDLYPPDQIARLPRNTCIIKPRGEFPYKGAVYDTLNHPKWCVKEKLNEVKGSYIPNPQKTKALKKELAEEKTEVIECHGEVIPPTKQEKAVQDAQNGYDAERAKQLEANEDANGEPIISEPQEVNLEELNSENQPESFDDLVELNNSFWECEEYTHITLSAEN